MIKTLDEWKRKDLLGLPVRDWQANSVYDSLLLVPVGKKHGSGWGLISIVGVRNGAPVEQASCYCDDIDWVIPDADRYGPNNEYATGQMRMDCLFPANIMHAWARNLKFKVGVALSSTTVRLIASEQ